MNRFKTFAITAGITALILMFSVNVGVCWQQPGVSPMHSGGPMAAPFPPSRMGPMQPPHYGPAPPPGCGPAPPPLCGPMPPALPFAPCMPKPSCWNVAVEFGGRAYSTTNSLVTGDATGLSMDWVRDLNLSQNTLVGEIYGGLRLPPSAAFMYTFQFPRLDSGFGALGHSLDVGSTNFPAGTFITLDTTRSLHRWELEYYPLIGCNYRFGPLLLAELLVNRLEVDGDLDADGTLETNGSAEFVEFYLGAGGVGEYAPEPNLFFRAKAAVTFLNNSLGLFADAEARYSPQTDPVGCNQSALGGVRPFLGGGYRFRTVNVEPSDTEEVRFYTHGPYAELGLIF